MKTIASQLPQIQGDVFLNLFPVGCVLSYSSENIPSNWVECDGSTLNRMEYPTLFNILGESHGQGDGSTTFHLPDYRGRFLRGSDESVGRDTESSTRTASNAGGATGDNVGSIQPSLAKLPSSNLTSTTDGEHRHAWQTGNGGGGSGPRLRRFNGTSSGTMTTFSDGNHTHTVSGGDGDTRPINCNLIYIIRVK